MERHQYNDNEDAEHKGIRQIENLFDKINDEDYYNSIKANGAFNDNYTEYESRGNKDRNLSLEDYLNIIKPFLNDMIDNHKASGEWKIQLVIKINFISSLYTDEFCKMYRKSNNV